MDHASDLGCRIAKLLRACQGHAVTRLVSNGNVNVLDVWTDDGRHFTVTVVQMEA